MHARHRVVASAHTHGQTSGMSSEARPPQQHEWVPTFVVNVARQGRGHVPFRTLVDRIGACPGVPKGAALPLASVIALTVPPEDAKGVRSRYAAKIRKLDRALQDIRNDPSHLYTPRAVDDAFQVLHAISIGPASASWVLRSGKSPLVVQRTEQPPFPDVSSLPDWEMDVCLDLALVLLAFGVPYETSRGGTPSDSDDDAPDDARGRARWEKRTAWEKLPREVREQGGGFTIVRKVLRAAHVITRGGKYDVRNKVERAAARLAKRDDTLLAMAPPEFKLGIERQWFLPHGAAPRVEGAPAPMRSALEPSHRRIISSDVKYCREVVPAMRYARGPFSTPGARAGLRGEVATAVSNSYERLGVDLLKWGAIYSPRLEWDPSLKLHTLV